MSQPFKDDSKQAFLNAEGADKPLVSPVPDAVLDRARAYRLARYRAVMDQHDVVGMLLFDPVNIRYAFDCSNMSIWTAHNPIRYGLIVNGGKGIMFEFKGCEHLNDGLPGVDEVRRAVGWMFMHAGERAEEWLEQWADEIAECAGKGRLAVDRMEPMGVAALSKRGIEVVDAGQITEMARSIKSEDEIELMRWTIRVAEAGMARIYEHSVDGVTENELWAHLHFENARSGGEWLETKLLTCGPNTNPWYKECSPRACRAGEMIAFDTDMIGPYGYCADLSRSWTCDYMPMTGEQRTTYGRALDQVNHNLSLIKAGMSFAEFNEKSWQIPMENQPYRYSLAAHGVGMADEWPVIPLHPDFASAHGGHFEAGQVICVESLMAAEGTESVKLETQVLVTETGAERLDTFPWEM
jgi:Xaa-Pro aminopeptidase